MIGTITLNAAIDKRYVVNNFVSGCVNRVSQCQYTAGGKGINVSRVARLTGEKVMATGFAGGFAGEYIIQSLKQNDIIPVFVKVEGESRSCINLYNCENGQQTELLEPGELVSSKAQEELFHTVDEMLEACDVIVASGSAPKGVKTDIYGKIAQRTREKDKKFLLDTSGELLKNALDFRPYMIKPNKDEMEAFTGIRMDTMTEIIREVEKLRDKGISLVTISLGKEGALVAAEDSVYKVSVPSVKTVNTVGCGDSMMAGFAVGLSRNYSMEKTLRFAAAVSVANAMQEQTGFIRMEDVLETMPLIKIEKI